MMTKLANDIAKDVRREMGKTIGRLERKHGIEITALDVNEAQRPQPWDGTLRIVIQRTC